MSTSTWIALGVIALLVVWVIAIYNGLVAMRQRVNQAFADIDVQLKQRHDLIPNLVETVKGFAAQERDVLLGVTNARAKVGSIQATPELVNDPQAFARFAQAQGELSSSLSRLLVVTENYPQLKSDANFRDLQAQLEGTENRITVARNRYIGAVREYNIVVRSFPSNLTAMLFGHKEKPQFTVENEKEISKPPKVDFGKPAAAPAPAVPASLPNAPSSPPNAPSSPANEYTVPATK